MPGPRPGRCLSSLLVQKSARSRRPRGHQRSRAENDARDGAYGEREHDSRRIERDLRAARQVGHIERDERAKRQPPDGESARRRAHGEHHALGSELSEQPSAAGAKRDARCEFFRARSGARNHQVHHVQAADEQEEQTASPHEPKRGLHVVDKRILQAFDHGVEPGVDNGLLELRNAIQVGPIDRVNFGLRLPDGRPGRQPCDVPPVVVVMLLLFGCCERERSPHRHIGNDEIESSRHHPDNRVRAAIDSHVPPEHGRVAAELAGPQVEGENGFQLAARFSLVVEECATEVWRNTREPEKRRRHAHDGNPNRHTALVDGLIAKLEQRLLLEHIGLA